jgi:Bacterial Ig-like domain
MVGRRNVTKSMSRLIWASAVALVAMLLVPLASASAAPPTLAITSPSEGSATASSTPTIAGTTDYEGAGVIVNIYAASEPVVPLETLSSGVAGGVWSVGASFLSDGSYTAVAEQTNAETSERETAQVGFTVDMTPPSISLTSPVSPTNDKTPSFSGAAGTAARDLPVVTVRIFNSSHQEAIAPIETTASAGQWSVGPVASLGDGTYEVLAEQSDQAGNVGRSSAHFTLDTTAPTPTIFAPAEGAHLSTSRPGYGGGAGTASGDSSSLTLNIYPGDTTSGTHESIPIARKGSSWSEAEGPHLADGTYTAQITQEDAAHNVGASTHTFTIETNTPHVTINSLPAFTNQPAPGFSGTIDTTKGVVESVVLRIYRGSSDAESAELAEQPITVAASGPTWSAASAAQLPDGTYTAQAEQENLAGTPGYSAPTTFTVDTQPPLVTLSAPAQSSGVELVSGTAGTASGDRATVAVELFAGSAIEPGQSPVETITVGRSSTGGWSAGVAGLESGVYSVRASQSDEAGNVGTSSPSTFTVTLPPAAEVPPAPPAPAPPNASFTWVPANPVVGQSVSLVSSSTDSSSAIGSFAWDVAGNGQFAGGGPAMTTSFASAGAHAVSLRVTDGNARSATVTETIKVLAATPKLMQPFPIVRIAGSETSYGASVRLLTVQAPLGAKVSITCVGGGCKTKAESRVAKTSGKIGSRAGAVTLAFARFERPLRAGALLQIRVTQSGEIGKFTSFAIRRNRLPVRTDACLPPASSKPTACPS